MVTGKLASLGSVGDTDGLALAGTFGVTHARLGERLFVFAAGEMDDGITVLELLPDGQLISLQSLFNQSDSALDDVTHFAVAQIGGQTFVYAAAQQDSAITVFRLGADGQLSAIEVIRDDATTAFGGPIGEMAVTSVGGETFLLATGEAENGVTSFRINAQGRLEVADFATDEMFARAAALAGARGVTTATVGQTQFAIVAGFQDDGLAVFEIDGQGGLTHRWSAFDLVSYMFELNGAIDVASAEVGGSTYVFGVGAYDDGISSFRLESNGYLTHVFSVSDGFGSSGLNGAEALESFTVAGESFLAVAAYQDDAITVFHIGMDGHLRELTSLRDTRETEFDGAAGLSVDVHEGRVIIFAGGLSDHGISALELGGGHDDLIGTDAADLSFGFAGDDTITGSAGADTIVGGVGRDMLTYRASTSGVSVDLAAGTGYVGDAEGDVIREIEFLVGSPHGDTLVGGSSGFGIDGGAGDDFIFGGDKNSGLTAEDIILLLGASPPPYEPTVSSSEADLGIDPLLGF